MQLIAMNRGSQAEPESFSLLQEGKNPMFVRSHRWFSVEATSTFLRSFESCIGMELSLVPEVEAVFVKADNASGKCYTVLTVINQRDPAIRERVYAREKAIMDDARGIDFNFRVISRMGRTLRDLINDPGMLAYQR